MEEALLPRVFAMERDCDALNQVQGEIRRGQRARASGTVPAQSSGTLLEGWSPILSCGSTISGLNTTPRKASDIAVFKQTFQTHVHHEGFGGV